MKKQTYLVHYDPRGTPLSIAAQAELEAETYWKIKHVFTGLWAVRTRLEQEQVAERFMQALRQGGGTDLVVAKIFPGKFALRGIGPQKVELLRRLTTQDH